LISIMLIHITNLCLLATSFSSLCLVHHCRFNNLKPWYASVSSLSLVYLGTLAIFVRESSVIFVYLYGHSYIDCPRLFLNILCWLRVSSRRAGL
uniref:Uncharacterized protein n=1 Tax=Petromyzon marinus TaxID=7757 RepID=S4RZD2_PETMA